MCQEYPIHKFQPIQNGENVYCNWCYGKEVDLVHHVNKLERKLKMKDYLGDGVYVEFTGFDYKLWTEREEGVHYIHFEPGMIDALVNFRTRCLKEQDRIDVINDENIKKVD